MASECKDIEKLGLFYQKTIFFKKVVFENFPKNSASNEKLLLILLGKFIFASLVVSFRHGREEDEIMGVSFKKDLVVDRVQVFPPTKQEDGKNKLQVIDIKSAKNS